MHEWINSGLENSCDSCKAAAGQRHPLEEWKDADIVPRSLRLHCGDNCHCVLKEVDATEPVGNLDDIPLVDNAKEFYGLARVRQATGREG